MAGFYRLRKRLGLADLRYRLGSKILGPTALGELDRAPMRETVGETEGAPMNAETSLALAQRIAANYAQGASSFPGYGDSMWADINRLAQPLHQLLLSGLPAEVASRLDHPHETNLFLGFDNPVAAPWGFHSADRNLLSNEVGPDMRERIYLSVRRLAEATGAAQLANPETLTGTAWSADDYLDAIEERISASLRFPNFYPREKGIVTRRGIVSFRPLQAIYQAWRLKTLGAQKVLEIGAGLGRTAFYAHSFGIRDYTIVDIPLSNVAQAHFLSRALGDSNVSLTGEKRQAVRILGPGFVENTQERFDIALNVDSLSEMDRQTGAAYVAFAARSAETFLSINREWADQARTADLSTGASVLRFPYWMREGYVEEIVTFS